MFALLGACAPSVPIERYKLHGEIVRLDSQDHIATIRHEKIEGWMEAMTMQFPVKNPKEFASLHPSDCIDATVFVQGNSIWIAEIVNPSGAGPCPAAQKNP
jgi:protein SCO1/2